MGSHAALRREATESRDDRIKDIARVKKAVHEHEKHDHPGTKETKLAGLKRGGEAKVEGAKRANGGRLDRKHGGKSGKGGGGSKVNVVVAPQSGPPQRVPVPVPVPAGGPPGAALRPPGPPVAGLGAGPFPGGAPPMPPAAIPHKRGGKVGRATGGSVGDPGMTAGAQSGAGRLEKARNEAKSGR